MSVTPEKMRETVPTLQISVFSKPGHNCMLQTIPNMSAAMESSTARKGWISSADERRVPKGPVQVYQCIDQCHLASFNSRELRRRQRPTDRARRPCVRASVGGRSGPVDSNVHAAAPVRGCRRVEGYGTNWHCPFDLSGIV